MFQRWIHALVHQPAVEVQLHVARALELFKDHIVHPRACLHQRRGDDRQRAALFNVGAEPKKRLGLCRAAASRPPESNLPDEGASVL